MTGNSHSARHNRFRAACVDLYGRLPRYGEYKLRKSPNGYKVCSECKFTKLLNEFSGVRSVCKACRRMGDKKRDVASVAQSSITKSRHKAESNGGLPILASLDTLVAAMTGYCDICGVAETSLPKRLCADHSHVTGRFRGWLCDRCNHTLGRIEDSVELARRIAQYLQESSNAISA